MKIESIIDVACSMAPNKESCPVTVNLLAELKSNKYEIHQIALRCETNPIAQDLLKIKMPVLMVSGVFEGGKSAKNLVNHSGLIVVDIDLKDNLTISNFPELKTELCKIPNVAYCGKSVRGKGFWLIIPIAYPEKHKLHFRFMEKWFATKGIKIDPSGENVNRLRFYSYDGDAYFNHAAEPLASTYSLPVLLAPSRSQNSVEASNKPIWEQYNTSNAFMDELDKAGWKIDSTNGNKTYFTRPGKESGTSAEFDSNKCVFYVFTENGQPFEFNKGYNPFQVYAILVHSGDFSKAAKLLCANLKTKNNQHSPSQKTNCPRSIAQRTKDETNKNQTTVTAETNHPKNLTKPNIQNISETENSSVANKRHSKVDNDFSRCSNGRRTQNWDKEIIQLETSYSGLSSLPSSVKLDPCTTITNLALFINSHLLTVISNNGNPSFLSYLNRLIELKKIFIQNQIL